MLLSSTKSLLDVAVYLPGSSRPATVRCRYVQPTAIQAQALPAALSGRDVLVSLPGSTQIALPQGTLTFLVQMHMMIPHVSGFVL